MPEQFTVVHELPQQAIGADHDLGVGRIEINPVGRDNVNRFAVAPDLVSQAGLPTGAGKHLEHRAPVADVILALAHGIDRGLKLVVHGHVHGHPSMPVFSMVHANVQTRQSPVAPLKCRMRYGSSTVKLLLTMIDAGGTNDAIQKCTRGSSPQLDASPR